MFISISKKKRNSNTTSSIKIFTPNFYLNSKNPIARAYFRNIATLSRAAGQYYTDYCKAIRMYCDWVERTKPQSPRRVSLIFRRSITETVQLTVKDVSELTTSCYISNFVIDALLVKARQSAGLNVNTVWVGPADLLAGIDMVTKAWTGQVQCQKAVFAPDEMFFVPFWVLPCYDQSRRHWVLVVCKVDNNNITAYILDSLTAAPGYYKFWLIQKLTNFFEAMELLLAAGTKRTITFQVVPSPQQKNSFDCALFTVQNAWSWMHAPKLFFKNVQDSNWVSKWAKEEYGMLRSLMLERLISE